MTTSLSSGSLKLSVLDGVGLYNRESASAAVEHSTRAAQLIDRLGFTRLWFTEHHNSRNQMSTSPDLFIAHMAALTENLRVGSGGSAGADVDRLRQRRRDLLHRNRTGGGAGADPGRPVHRGQGRRNHHDG